MGSATIATNATVSAIAHHDDHEQRGCERSEPGRSPEQPRQHSKNSVHASIEARRPKKIQPATAPAIDVTTITPTCHTMMWGAVKIGQ